MRSYRPTVKLPTIVVAVFALSLRVPAATPDPALEKVLERWLEATEVRGTVVKSDTLEDGIAGHAEEWVDRDGWRRVTSQHARLREEVWHRGVAWVRDWNGKVQELAGRDRRDQLIEAHIQGLLFGGRVRDVLTSGEAELVPGGEAGSVIRIHPAGGSAFDVELDDGSGLPARIELKTSGDEITLLISDWRTVDARKFPFSIRRVLEEEDDRGSQVTVRSVTVSRRAHAFSRPIDGPKDYKFTKGASALGIPFNFENDHLMVQGRVNGSKPIWFMLDTGADSTIVNKARLAELGLRPFGGSSISGGGNSTELAFADVARLEIGGVTILNQRNGVIDLTGLERIYGMPMGGILGYDFYSRFAVRVSYDTRAMDLLEPSPGAYQSSGTQIPFILEEGQPHVASKVTVASGPPIDADFIIDSGAADTINFTSPFVTAHRLLERARKTPAPGPNTMAGSEKEFFAQTSVRGRLESVELGPFQLRDIPVNLMLNAKGAYASERFSGVIGEGVLRRFNAIYDYSKNVMIIEPNADLAKPFPARRTFGATFLSGGPDYTQFTVSGIRKDSPAEAAGLRKDDVVLAIDATPAAQLRLADVRRLLTEDGARRAITIRRGDQTITLEAVVSLVTLDEN